MGIIGHAALATITLATGYLGHVAWDAGDHTTKTLDTVIPR